MSLPVQLVLRISVESEFSFRQQNTVSRRLTHSRCIWEPSKDYKWSEAEECLVIKSIK
jgi:hypothetical protein